MRYAAPSDVTEVYLSTGPLTVVDGFVDVPDDASTGDLAGLSVNGFTSAPKTEVATTANASSTAKDDPTADSTSDEKTA